MTTAPGYAIGLLRDVVVGPDIAAYLDRIDGTLTPHGGRFVIHGGRCDLIEGQDPGTVVVIGFPSLVHAEQWYRSDGYQAILALRTDNATGAVVLVEGVLPGHRAPDVLRDRSA